jgi:hypothetical protein
MSGTRRTLLARHPTVQITQRAIDLFRELERANRARKRAIDCTISEFGHCIAECCACCRWWDLQDELHIELGLPPWQWPCIPRNPYPRGSPKARDWRPGAEQEELWDDKGEVIEQPYARIGTLYIARACSSVMRYSRRSCA